MNNFKIAFGITSDEPEEVDPYPVVGSISEDNVITLNDIDIAGSYTLAYCGTNGTKLDSWDKLGVVEV